MKTAPHSTACTLLLLLIFCSTSALAYTGGFAAIPPLPGGPSTNTVTNFKVDTTTTNPETITTNLNFVQQVIIQTSVPISSNLLITENPSSASLDLSSFSFTVPQPLQNALQSATIYFWGPDQPVLPVQHIHRGVPTEILIATRANPPQADSQGRVLWTITTTSFSDFVIKAPHKPRPLLPLAIYATITALCSISAIILFRNTHVN